MRREEARYRLPLAIRYNVTTSRCGMRSRIAGLPLRFKFKLALIALQSILVDHLFGVAHGRSPSTLNTSRYQRFSGSRKILWEA